mmetsp:Transcript_28905/g.51677  ORF Transcript_28905/g.51677 Transcript_28905/m.51677 type:complete len:101 (+) Transcript_28905:2637-2939(+)
MLYFICSDFLSLSLLRDWLRALLFPTLYSLALTVCPHRTGNGEKISFDVDAFRRHCLLNGLDDIGLTLAKDDKISEFEAKRSAETPWLDGIGYAAKLAAA